MSRPASTYRLRKNFGRIKKIVDVPFPRPRDLLALSASSELGRLKLDIWRLLEDEVNRAREVTEYASGKGINVARVLTQLGEAALAAGFEGGRRGDFLIEDCARWNVPTDFVRVTGETRLCTTIIERASGTVTELVEEAPPASHQEWTELVRRIDKQFSSSALNAVPFAGFCVRGNWGHRPWCFSSTTQASISLYI